MLKKIVAVTTLLLCLSVNAQTTDYTFGTDGTYNGWTPSTSATMTGPYGGNGVGVSIVNGTQTVSCCGTNVWAVSPYTGSYMVGLQPGNTQQNSQYSNMASSLGLSAASVSALNAEIAAQNPSGGGAITNATWISKDFSFQAGTKFKMAWNYISTDYVPFNDGSITTLVNTGSATTFGKINGISAQYLLLGATNPGTGNYSTGSYGSTGWQIVNYEITSAGSYKLGFAVFNQGDTALSPVLFVNDAVGTTTKNGETFGAVAPNDPSMPVSDVITTPTTPTTPSTPVVTTETSTSVGTPVVTSSIAYGATAVTIALANSRGEQAPKTLQVTQTKTETDKTPFTLTTVTQTPVTTTTVTKTDGVVTGTTSSTAVEETTSSISGEEVIEIQTNKNYATRIDQYDYLKNANERINMSLDSDVLSRHEGSDNLLKSKTGLFGNDKDGYTYLIAEGQRSNSFDTYRMNTQRYGFGHEKNVYANLLVGAQYNYVTSNLTGDQSGGSLEKNHVGLYTLLNLDGWLLKSDLGVAVNTYKNYHRIDELQLSNQGKANGVDAWLANRLYTPSLAGFRPYAGVRVQTSQRSGLTEGGSEVSAMSYAKINNTNTIGEGGLRYDNTVFDAVNLTAEAGRTTNDITTFKLGASFTPTQNVLGGVTIGQQRQQGVVNNIAQVSLKVLF